DGIRARTVTGVQTCALPISARESHRDRDEPRLLESWCWLHIAACRSNRCAIDLLAELLFFHSRCTEHSLIGRATKPWYKGLTSRSEERRVGKECRVLGVAGS